MADLDNRVEKEWSVSRAGARAGRGFHYQHLFTVAVILRQWAGLDPAGSAVPEGLEDCVIELADWDVWIQIKSRASGLFSGGEVEGILRAMRTKRAQSHGSRPLKLAVGLEQGRYGCDDTDMSFLFHTDDAIVVCNSPQPECLKLLTQRLSVPDIIAEGILADLYKLVAEAAAANASLPFATRKRISTTEVERRIFERLEAEDPSAIDAAYSTRVLEPVDFSTFVSEPGFYRGVKVKPGHVASGLALPRPDETAKVLATLRAKRHALIVGPSGAGKSALLWLSAAASASRFRWIQVTAKASGQDVDAILKFVRSRRPREDSPIALAFDEIGPANHSVWNILVHELRAIPDTYFLGAVRKEDLPCILNRADTGLIDVALDATLAESMWRLLVAAGQCNLTHWREAFERAGGLLLEYVHILTQGDRLAAVICEQVRQRERDSLHDELAIIRATSAVCAHGGEVDAKKLFSAIHLSEGDALAAMRRLLDEHLVRESAPGVLGGLHPIRSEALAQAAHDEIVFEQLASLWRGIPATTPATLPRVIQNVLATQVGDKQPGALRQLAASLSTSPDAAFWTAILTGLGLASIEAYVRSFQSILERRGINRAHWSLAAMFGATSLDVPELSQFEQWSQIREAVHEFRSLPKQDLRLLCLEMLPGGVEPPRHSSLEEANRLLSCLVPIVGGEPIHIKFLPEFGGGELQIESVAAFLSTARLLGPEVAELFVTAFGGEKTLLTWFHSQTPWVKAPVYEESEEHGRVLRADFFYVSDEYQTDPHEFICNVCEALIALAPSCNAVACDAIDPSGHPIVIGGRKLWSKCVPRAGLPAKAAIAWNATFRHVLMTRASTESLSSYALQMAGFIRKSEKMLRTFSERWVKAKNASLTEQLASQINDCVAAVNSLAFSAPAETPAVMTRPSDAKETEDTVGALIVGTLSNLIPRLGKMPGSDAKTAAMFASDLAHQAREHSRSPIWRTVVAPPEKELEALATRLFDIASILHEMAHDQSRSAVLAIVNAGKKGGIGKAVRFAARHCRTLADKRLELSIRKIETTLRGDGWCAKGWVRPDAAPDCPYWPASEVAITVEIADFEKDGLYFEAAQNAGKAHLSDRWRFRVVPIVGGKVIPGLAMLPANPTPRLDPDFFEQWKDQIQAPFLKGEVSRAFDSAIEACHALSAIAASRKVTDLAHDEDKAFDASVTKYRRCHQLLSSAVSANKVEIFAVALNYIESVWNTVVDEINASKDGQPIAHPSCIDTYRAMSGKQVDRINELGALRMLLCQGEARLTN